jgi:addiction module RelE/StbE family toxin
MAYKLFYPESYIRRALMVIKRHSEIIGQYQKTLELLEINPHHPSLRLHPLKGKLAGLHSISINISYRISLEMVISEQEIILINIGTHDEVY